MEVFNVFSEKFSDIIKGSVKSVLLEREEIPETLINSPEDWVTKTDNNFSCSYCRVKFDDIQLQRDHYKLDWHRYNLKQSLFQKPPITEGEFDKKNGNDDLSSISGSDSEKEDTLDTFAIAQGKIFLQNDNGQVFSLYRCLLFERKEDSLDSILTDRLKQCCITNKQWTILMLGGGHFAGAIFKGDEPILHKTFHCYTVRAGQGGSQSSRDKSGGPQPKSAGASLRRYNEQSLVQHVKSIVEVWKEEIDKSSLIIYRASGPYNRSVLFGGAQPLLERSDKRLRTIPFSTRRATFTEVKRVHLVLTQAYIYPSLDSATASFAKQKSPENDAKRAKARSSCINRAKSREIIERPLPGVLSNSSSIDTNLEKLSVEETIELHSESLEISFEGLEEYSDSLTPEQRKKGQYKKKKPKKSKAKKLREQEESRKKALLDVLIKGNVLIYKEMLDGHLNNVVGENEEVIDRNEIKSAFVNQVMDENGNTQLHITALNNHCELMSYLLENEADPCIKNKNQQTAYTSTQSKEIRDLLKQFAKENPDKYNYNKAQIPTNTLTNEEIAEKKKAQRKVKKEKEKEKKKELGVLKKEQEEKDRFIKLSDREKRALAAEKRILNNSGQVTSRCFLCGSDMAGKVPFEYSGNRFCTVDCLKAHRLKNPVTLS